MSEFVLAFENLTESYSVHIGHHHIGYDQIYRTAAKDGKGSRRAFRRYDGIVSLKDFLEETRHTLVVVYDQDGIPAGRADRLFRLRRRFRHGLGNSIGKVTERQFHDEGSPAFHVWIDVSAPAMHLGETADQGQPDADTAETLAIRCLEEGFEHFFAKVRSQWRSIVPNRQAEVVIHPLKGNTDLALAILGRIAEKVAYDFEELLPVYIGNHALLAKPGVQVNSILLERNLPGLQDRFQELSHVSRGLAQDKAILLNNGQVQHLPDHLA